MKKLEKCLKLDVSEGGERLVQLLDALSSFCVCDGQPQKYVQSEQLPHFLVMIFNIFFSIEQILEHMKKIQVSRFLMQSTHS